MSDLNQTLNKTIGFGTAPLGNMFRNIPEDEARSTVEAAWNEGIRYFDTAPFYGAGLAEKRLGATLSQQPRDEFVLSTKVGRYMLDETEEKSGLFADGRNSGALLGGDHFDYAEATPAVKERVAQLHAVAGRHQVSLKDAALQFSMAHPATAAVIPGSSRPGRIAEDIAGLKTQIPAAFWEELLHEGLISPKAPLPQA